MNQYFEALKMGTIVLGIFVLLTAAAFFCAAVRGIRKGKRKKKLFSVMAVLVTVLSLAITAGLSYAAGTFTNSIDMIMSQWNTAEDGEDMESWKALAAAIAEEGMVLMKNKDNTLPLQAGQKVNLLGYCAYFPLLSGTGTGIVSSRDPVSIVQALEDAGLEVNLAPGMSGIYGDWKKSGTKDTERIGFITADFSMRDVPAQSYEGEAAFERMREYSGTAVIVIGRNGAEGKDLPYGKENDYLKLNQNEESLLAASRENFDKIIVVINSANAMELGWMEEYDVDAVIWAGLPGPYGFSALGKILSGEVNPSGRLPDTWVYHHGSHPASENFGVQEAENAEGRYYLDYVEGIYVGYKWYETAFAERAVITNTKTGETFDFSNYESIVAFPFGYGLSYTDFSQDIVGGTLEEGMFLEAKGTYTLEVAVTNTGDMAGKCVVQVYAGVPYTEYDKQNGVEKPEVQLIAYGKTEVLQPGASETVVLEIAMEELASYDSSFSNPDGTKGAYMLDAGEYIFSVRSDAHNAYAYIGAQLPEQYFFSGDDRRSSDKQAASNHFEQAARGEYLSRQNAFANYEAAMRAVSAHIENLDYVENDNSYDASFDNVVDRVYKEGVDYGAPGQLRLEELAGLDYDDPKWEELISQLTMEELISLTGNTMYSSPAVSSVAKERTNDVDGPLGISSMFSKSLVSAGFPCVPLLAASYNTELAYEMGRSVAEQAEYNRVTSWYAPGINTHRFFYGGRNFEYYSEDAVLGARTAASEVLGARDGGLTVYLKHFVLNDMEQNRARLHTYCNEQAIREIYLKPAEYAVKYGKATGVMSSMNYIGDIYAGGHAGLLTDVLRGEWGFQGCVLTDMDQAGENRSFWGTIRAGVDVWLGFQNTEMIPTSDADIYYLQRAAHNHLYAWVNGNTFGIPVLNWQLYFNIIYIELSILAVSCAAAFVLRNRKKNRNKI
ncbi:MAG: glycoside hydrolase family 3 C-terminal domain-containing protein [Acetatifactor sp.]|nr:glycoside hydrolase family 3 C-terminal domain-containing protein [Acetatifactor sp.]